MNINKVEIPLAGIFPNPVGWASRPTSPTEKKDDKKLKEICQEFESIFLYYLLKEMRNTVPKTGLLDGGRAEEFFQEMLDEELSKHLSRANGIGIAQMLYKQLSLR